MTDRPLTLGMHGLGQSNLGSHLMALSVRQALPDATLAATLRVARLTHLLDLLEPSGAWIWSDLGGSRQMHKMNTLGTKVVGRTVVPLRPRPRPPQLLDAVLDLSGFAYGDAFSERRIERMADWMDIWRRWRIPVVFLPQSFGPYSSAAARTAMRSALSNATLVYARDDASQTVLSELGADVEIRRAPDIAIATAAHLDLEPSAVPGEQELPAEPYVLLLPNRQVTAKTTTPEHDYLEAIIAVARAATAAGLAVVVASHEGRSDVPLAEAVTEAVPTVRFVGALDVHSMLGLVRGARFVVSSRFHGLVAALANGIPVLAIGWAAKYQALLADFHCEQFSLDVTTEDDLSQACARGFADLLEASDELRPVILAARADRLAELDVLWDEVRRACASRREHD